MLCIRGEEEEMADLGMARCPLCLEEMDATDSSFKPCQCGYQVCVWCWHQIIDRVDGKCPNCRREYQNENIRFDLDPSELEKEQKLKEAKKRQKRETGKQRKDLSNVRVIQRNLVYVVGIPASLSREEILCSPEYFGQYGRILKIVISHAPPSSAQHRNSCGAYVTFADSGSARSAIECVDGAMLSDRCLRASFGTTKYCSFFLRQMRCTNPECMYLHEIGDDSDTFTKEDMFTRKTAFQEAIHPPSRQENPSWRGRGLPPLDLSSVGVQSDLMPLSASFASGRQTDDVDTFLAALEWESKESRHLWYLRYECAVASMSSKTQMYAPPDEKLFDDIQLLLPVFDTGEETNSGSSESVSAPLSAESRLAAAWGNTS